MENDTNYNEYVYKNLQEETYLLYDEKQLGSGFFIVTKESDAIRNFVNINLSKESLFSRILIRGYEKNLSHLSEKEVNGIQLTIKKANPLFNSLNTLSEKLRGRKISSIDTYNHGKNYMKITSSDDEVIVTIVQDTIKASNNSDFVDIALDNTFVCLFYSDMLNFYNELSKLASKNVTKKDVKQLLLTK